MMKIFVVGILLVIAAGIFLAKSQTRVNILPVPTPVRITQITTPTQTDLQTQTIAENLDTPWAIAFLSDKSMLITERKGSIRRVNASGELENNPIATITNAREIGEGGLLGITLHPDFSSNPYIYLYYTYSNSDDDTLNRVVRMTYDNGTLSNETIIVNAIPGAANHNGGRIKFGPDSFLYIGTGDAQNPSQAQDTSTLGGKILRVTDEGKPAPDNAFGNPVFSYGHRNVQGLAWNSDGTLWATEHGRSGALSGLDELNLIQLGKNYGWPEIQGNETRSGMETPYKNSGAQTWAPAGAAFIGNSLFYGGLRGETLYEAIIIDNDVKEIKEHFKGQLGRIREVIAGFDGMLYITTSNNDGRGNPHPADDKIIRVNPQLL